MLGKSPRRCMARPLVQGSPVPRASCAASTSGCALELLGRWSGRVVVRLRPLQSICDVLHDASTLLDVRPRRRGPQGCVPCAKRTRQLTATWPKKRSVHGLVAQKRRAGVFWPRRPAVLGQTLDARERAVCSYAGEKMHGRTCPRTYQNTRHTDPKSLRTHQGRN